MILKSIPKILTVIIITHLTFSTFTKAQSKIVLVSVSESNKEIIIKKGSKVALQGYNIKLEKGMVPLVDKGGQPPFVRGKVVALNDSILVVKKPLSSKRYHIPLSEIIRIKREYLGAAAATGIVSGLVVSFAMLTITDGESAYSPLVSIGIAILITQVWEKFINPYKNVNQDFWQKGNQYILEYRD